MYMKSFLVKNKDSFVLRIQYVGCWWPVLRYIDGLVQDCSNSSALTMELTHWGQNKMTAISQTTLSNAFSWMKMVQFLLKLHWILFIRIQLTIFQHWFRWWLGADQATSHYLKQWWLDYRRIYASLGLNELKQSCAKPSICKLWSVYNIPEKIW